MPPLDPVALGGVAKSDKEEPWYIYWSERGGTPQGIPPQYAPIPIAPWMRLWLRIDEELLGATDESGCYYRPESLETVLGWYLEPIRVSLERMISDYGPETSDAEILKSARSLLRYLASGRAEARSEAYEDD